MTRSTILLFALSACAPCASTTPVVPPADASLPPDDAAPSSDASEPLDAGQDALVAAPDAPPESPAPVEEAFCLSDLTFAGCAPDRVVCAVEVHFGWVISEGTPTCVDPEVGGRGACFVDGVEVEGTTWCLDCVTDACRSRASE